MLRNSVIHSKKTKIKERYLVFDKDIKVPLNMSTAWLSPFTKKQYNLGSLWLFLEFGHKQDYFLKLSELDL